MGNYDIHNSKTSWHSLIAEAQKACGYQLTHGIDHYLALTLDAYAANTALASTILATQLLENLSKDTVQSTQQVRAVGDQCLIMSGLFPERATRRSMSLSYYIDMGKWAYMELAGSSRHLKLDNELFYHLGTHFVGLMDVLHQMTQARPLH